MPSLRSYGDREMKILPLLLIAASAFAQTAIFPGGVVTDNQLGIAANITRAQLSGSVGLTDTTFNVTNSSCVKAGFSASCASTFVPNMMLVLDNEAVQICQVTPGAVTTALKIGHSSCPNIDGRGFDSTVIATHNAAIISSINIAWNHNAMAKEVEAIEAGLAGTSLLASTFNFTPQTPGGSLIIGSNTVAINPGLQGVSGSDVGHSVYVSGGTGTAEPCLITGGTATSGVAGTIVMTCARTHSSGWTISSVLAGMPEAVYVACARSGGTVVIAPGNFTQHGTMTIPCSNITLQGGGGACCGLGTWISRTEDFGHSVSVGMGSPALLQVNAFKMFDLSFAFNLGSGIPTSVSQKPTTGAHVILWSPNTVNIERCRFENMVYNIEQIGGSYVTIRDNQFVGLWNPSVPATQITKANYYITKTSLAGVSIPTWTLLDNNNIGSSFGNDGPDSGVRIESAEDLEIRGSSISSASGQNILITGTTALTLLNIRIHHVKFDSAGNPGNDVVLTTDGTVAASKVIFDHNICNGENIGGACLFVPFLNLTFPAFFGLTIDANQAYAYRQSPFSIGEGEGFTVTGNIVHSYNSMNENTAASATSAVYVWGSANNGNIAGNIIGGGQNFGTCSTCLYGISLAGPTGFQANVYIQPGNSVTVNGLATTNPSPQLPTFSGSTCGTSPIFSPSANDNNGAFTTGSGSPTSCVITFYQSQHFMTPVGTPRAPYCTVTPSAGGSPPAITVSSTALTVTTTTPSAVYNWKCQ